MPLIADAQGRIEGRLQIPAGVPVGTKLVQFRGETSRGEAAYTGEGWRTIETRRSVQISTLAQRLVTSQPRRPGGDTSGNGGGMGRADPQGQTFTLVEDRYLAGLDLKFSHVGASGKPCIVQFRETAIGFPTEVVLAQKVLPASQMLTDRASWTRVLMDIPALARGGSTYAFVILTDDAEHAIRIANIGEYDEDRGWVTAQPYTIGVRVSSSNGQTWTAHQGSDIAFRLLGARFTSSSRLISLGTVDMTGVTDVLPLPQVELPSGTEAIVRLEDESGRVMTTTPGAAIALPAALDGEVEVSIELRGTDKLSPILYPTVPIALGTIAGEGDYVSRAFPCAADDTIVVYADVFLPGASTALVEAQNNGGDWDEVAVTQATPLGDGWVEWKLELAGLEAGTARIRITLTGSAAARCRLRKPRAVTRAEI